MAEASTEGYLHKSVECSICLKIYNTQERVPKAFPCLHTICQKCVVQLSKGTSFKCPTCNQITDVSKLITNFGLCNVVEKVCQSCGSREKDVECQHCNQSVCSICLDEHAKIFHGEVKATLGELEKEINIALDASRDKSALEAEMKKASATIEEIKKSMDYHLTKFQEYQQKLIAQVKEMKTSNVEQRQKWVRNIYANVDRFAASLHRSEDMIEHSGDCPVDEMKKINTESIKLLIELRGILASTPAPIDYKFVASSTAVNIGDIIIQPATSGSQPRPVTDYQHWRSKATTGSKGSGPGEFAGDSYVTCMGDRYIVSDTQNHRLQVYDMNVTLMCILGTKGDREDQFNNPAGRCTGPGGELVVCDSGNHRIKVYSEYLQLERTFGSNGSGDNEFNAPIGLTFTSTELIVCDTNNYRVKVHRPDGTYIRSIGSRGSGTGQFTNNPISVAATPDGCVLVNELNAASLHMFKINGDYVRTITASVPNSPGAIKIWGFTVDPDGNIIIGDKGNHRLIVLDAGEQFVCTIGSRGGQPGEVNYPVSVSVNGNRDIIVYEHRKNRVQLFEM